MPSSLLFSASETCSFVLYSLTSFVLTSAGGREGGREGGRGGREGGREGGWRGREGRGGREGGRGGRE